MEYKAIRPKILSILCDKSPQATSSWALTAIRRAPRIKSWPITITDTDRVDSYAPTIYIVCEDPPRLDDRLGEVLKQTATSLRVEVTVGFVGMFGQSLSDYGCPWYEEKQISNKLTFGKVVYATMEVCNVQRLSPGPRSIVGTSV